MKRKILILIFSVFLTFTFCITSFASVGSDTYGPNLLDDSVQNILYFSSSPGNSTGVNSHVISFSDNSSYTFLSDIGISDFYLAPIVNNVAYGYDSLNLFGEQIFDKTCLNSYDSTSGYNLYNTGCIRANYSNNLIDISSGIVSISFSYFCPTDLIGRAIFFTINYTDGSSDVINTLSSVNIPTDVSYTSDTSKVVSNVVISSGDCPIIYLKNLCIRNGSDSSYVPFYGKVYHSSDFTSLYSFTTDIVYNDYALVFGSPHSGVIPVDNTFYLLSGNKSYNSLNSGTIESNYNRGFNVGYNEGYSVGQSDGLKASNSLSSMVYSILSAPFVIVSNTLNFEILGINILNLVKVILTILLIAFVITRLKGRE